MSVKSFTHFVPDLGGNRQRTVVRVGYDEHCDEFYITAPDHLVAEHPSISHEKIGDRPATETRHTSRRIWGRTPNEARDKFISACYAYEKAVTKVRKVIVYRLKYTMDNMGDDDHDGLHFESGTGLIVHWDVGFEVKTGDVANIYRHNPVGVEGIICNNRLVGSEDHKIIDWTEQREAFFENLDKKLKGMVARAREFLGDDKRLALAIDKGRFDLLLEHDASKGKKET